MCVCRTHGGRNGLLRFSGVTSGDGPEASVLEPFVVVVHSSVGSIGSCRVSVPAVVVVVVAGWAGLLFLLVLLCRWGNSCGKGTFLVCVCGVRVPEQEDGPDRRCGTHRTALAHLSPAWSVNDQLGGGWVGGREGTEAGGM